VSNADETQYIFELAQHCTVGGRLPTRLVRLADAVEEHGEGIRSKVEAILLDEGRLLRIAHRAAQAAPGNVLGAERIIGSMERLVGRDVALAHLEQADYVPRLLALAERFARPQKDQLGKSLALLGHLINIYGESRADVLSLRHFIRRQRKLARQSTLLEPTPV
jgi:hypothetical protein